MKWLSVCICCAFLLAGCQTITDPKPEECKRIGVLVEKIKESGRYDIQLHDAHTGNWYYINRGLEKGLTIDELAEEVRDQAVELWVVKDSRHIAQLKKGEDILYTEFDQ